MFPDVSTYSDDRPHVHSGFLLFHYKPMASKQNISFCFVLRKHRGGTAPPEYLFLKAAKYRRTNPWLDDTDARIFLDLLQAFRRCAFSERRRFRLLQRRCSNFINLKMMHRLNLLKVCVHKDEYMCVCINILRLYCV